MPLSWRSSGVLGKHITAYLFLVYIKDEATVCKKGTEATQTDFKTIVLIKYVKLKYLPFNISHFVPQTYFHWIFMAVRRIL